MRKFRLTRDMVQAAPGGSTVSYTEEQVEAIIEYAPTRESQDKLLEYVAAGGHLSLVWLHSTISPESPNYSSAPRRSLYSLHLCATSMIRGEPRPLPWWGLGGALVCCGYCCGVWWVGLFL